MNEKVLSTIIAILYSVLMFLGGGVIGYNLYARPIGGNNQFIKYVQRTAEEQQREFETTIGELESEVRDLKSNSDKAKSIVDSMGVQLDDSAGDIRRAAELLKTLRAQIMDLQDLYSSSNDSHRSSDVEGM